jgi:hypothetical protein
LFNQVDFNDKRKYKAYKGRFFGAYDVYINKIIPRKCAKVSKELGIDITYYRGSEDIYF